MHTAVGPASHCKVKKVPEADRASVAEHIVVLVRMKDEPRSTGGSPLHSTYPSLERLVMVFHNEVNGPISPREQAVEFFDRIIKETKVV